MTKEKETSKDIDDLYFEVQADLGISKHIGGMKATRELAEACRLKKGSDVLEIGCGIGVSPCFLADKLGAKVTAVDISEGMIERSRERAKRKGLEGRVEFVLADARDLPFRDGVFDVVVCESVTAFIDDKPKALSEYIRVARHGGYVGMNECRWIKPPPDGLVEYVSRIMAGARFMDSDGWEELLIDSGLDDISARAGKMKVWSQWLDEIRQFDAPDLFGAWGRFLSGILTNPSYRKFARGILGDPKNLFRFTSYLGYGIYAGRKA